MLLTIRLLLTECLSAFIVKKVIKPSSVLIFVTLGWTWSHLVGLDQSCLTQPESTTSDGIVELACRDGAEVLRR